VLPELPTNLIMNYLGVLFAALSTIFYLFIKSETTAQKSDENEPLIEEIHTTNSSNDTQPESGDSVFDRMNPKTKKILGTCLAIMSGVLYGVTFTPYLYVRDNYIGASQNGLDYVFSLYTGILVSSVVYFSIYCIVKKNRPQVHVQAIFPGK
jgi:hypothetical protein